MVAYKFLPVFEAFYITKDKQTTAFPLFIFQRTKVLRFFSICEMVPFLLKSNISPGKVKLTRICQCDIVGFGMPEAVFLRLLW